MKKNDIFVATTVVVAMTFTACAGSASQKAENDADTTVAEFAAVRTLADDAAQTPRFVTDSVHWADSLVMGNCRAKAMVTGQYPVSGAARLVDSVRTWLGDQLSYNMQNSGERMFCPSASELASGSKLAERCSKAMLESARSDFKDFVNEDFSINYEYYYSFGPSYLTDSILTYYLSGYVYLGGAHGSALGSGQSFEAGSGRRLSYDNIFLPGKQAEVISLIRDALWQQYFKPDSEPGGTLKDVLLIQPDALELPSAQPLFSDKGLVLIYQQYEIAPYAAGMPSCVLPYSELKPLMRPEVARLLK